jgi:hypothetical protein
MRNLTPVVGLLLLLTAPPVPGDDAAFSGLPAPGMRVRAQIAREYSVSSFKLGERLLEVSGEVVRRDALTLTVVSPNGEEARYPGARARLAGRVVAIDGDSLRLDLDDGKADVLVPWSAIERLDVARREPRQLGGKGAAIGAIVPGIPLGLFGMVVFSMGNLDCESHCSGGAPLLGAALGVGAGALIGGLVGTAMSDDGWEEVKVGLAVAPRPGKGFAGALYLRF